jgi:hypothetical protein
VATLEAGLSSAAELLRLVPRALLFDGDVYRAMKARPRAVCDGASLLLLLGLGLGVAAAAGAIVAWGAAPEPEARARLLVQGLARLPVVARLGPAAAPWLDRLAAAWAGTGSPALRRLLTVPLALLAGWLGYGLVAQRAACRLGGRGGLGETLACTALAEAPRALLLLPILPPLGAAALGIEAWVLAARFQALRAAHSLDGWRAFWAALASGLLVAAAHLTLWLLGLAAGGGG